MAFNEKEHFEMESLIFGAFHVIKACPSASQHLMKDAHHAIQEQAIA